MRIAKGELYVAEVHKHLSNSPFQYAQETSFSFRCKVASSAESKRYTVTKGLEAKKDGTMLYATNLEGDIEPSDHVVFRGKTWLVESVGYYEDESRLVDGSSMSAGKLISKLPKGVVLV